MGDAMSDLAESVSLAIAAIRLRASEASDPAAVHRVLNAAAIHLASALGADTHTALIWARDALDNSDPVSDAAYRITFAAGAARAARIDAEMCASDLAYVASALSVAA